MWRHALAGFLIASGCAIDEAGLESDAGVDAAIDASTKDVTVLDAPPPDATPDAPPPPACDPNGAFGSFVDLGGGVNTDAYEGSPFLTSDELLILFARDVGGGRLALFWAARATPEADFGTATKVTTISTNATYDTAPFVDDALTTLYFSSSGRNGSNRYHLYRASGKGSPDGWSQVQPLTALNTTDPHADLQMWLAAATGEVWFASDRLGSLDLYESASTTAAPAYQTFLATSAAEVHPVLSSDALTLWFGRSDGTNVVHVFSATRPSTAVAFASPQQDTDFDEQSSNNVPGWISPDGCRMYFTSDRGGDSDVWTATRAP